MMPHATGAMGGASCFLAKQVSHSQHWRNPRELWKKNSRTNKTFSTGKSCHSPNLVCRAITDSNIPFSTDYTYTRDLRRTFTTHGANEETKKRRRSFGCPLVAHPSCPWRGCMGARVY
ncbi:hypothetical protein LY78DRAFT_654491 [Colletotrichum sublineola]|nr:hypothetical protein LY78DRAFT_654491 [Colletotrichum sublineola]